MLISRGRKRLRITWETAAALQWEPVGDRRLVVGGRRHRFDLESQLTARLMKRPVFADADPMHRAIFELQIAFHSWNDAHGLRIRDRPLDADRFALEMNPWLVTRNGKWIRQVA